MSIQAIVCSFENIMFFNKNELKKWVSYFWSIHKLYVHLIQKKLLLFLVRKEFDLWWELPGKRSVAIFYSHTPGAMLIDSHLCWSVCGAALCDWPSHPLYTRAQQVVVKRILASIWLDRHCITIVPSLQRRKLSRRYESNLPRTYNFKFPRRENTF